MSSVTRAIALLAAAAVVWGTTAYGAGGDSQPGQPIAANCTACHGRDGNQTANQTTPKLARQLSPYLAKELYNFQSGARKSPAMAAIASTLSDQDIKNVAEYFQSRKITADKLTDATLAAEGERMFTKGIATNSVPACASCHGDRGEGMPLAIPRLAGQHADYIVAQLKNFKSGARANDPNHVMGNIAAKLDNHQMKAVASYLSRL